MAAYVRLVLRLVIFCVLVIGAVLLSEPPSALANGCCSVCAREYDACLTSCEPKPACDLPGGFCDQQLQACDKTCDPHC